MKQQTRQTHSNIRHLIVLTTLICIMTSTPVMASGNDSSHCVANVQISELSPLQGEGYGYRLVYRVPVDIDTFWRFKTDFDNDFLVKNSTITSHRLLRRQGNVAVTKTTYTAAPGKFFIWETTTDPANRKMQFRLVDPRSSGQRHHWGFIRLIPDGRQTIVIQQAYFDFTGAGIWVAYPWQGGMRDVLRTNAIWEHETIMRLQASYQ